MTIHYSKRILCCFLALLVFGFCLMRPMAITANATAAGTAAMAGVVGIAPEIAIPAIIIVLGISAVAANWDDICDFTEELIDNICIEINGDKYIPAYNYNNQLYVSQDVVNETVYTLETYFYDKYDYAWDVGRDFTYMYSSGDLGDHEITIFADNPPTVTNDGNDILIAVPTPAIVHDSLWGGIDSEIYEFMDTTLPQRDITLYNQDAFTFETSTIATIADLSLESTLKVVNTDGDEEDCFPIASSTSISYVNTESKVTVFDDSATETLPNTSTVDLSGVLGWLQNIWRAIKNIDLSVISNRLLYIWNELKSLGETITTPIVDAISSVIDSIIEWLISIGASLSDILEWIKTLPASIASAISGVLTDIFVPAEDYVTTKVESLCARFTWIEPIVVFCKDMAAEFGSATPPVIYVHLEDAESDVDYGGTVKFLDMSWYARYKDYGDLIISGFLWSIFCWRMYIKLPGIINGVSGDIGQMTYGESKWQRAESRSKRKGGSDE